APGSQASARQGCSGPLARRAWATGRLPASAVFRVPAGCAGPGRLAAGPPAQRRHVVSGVGCVHAAARLSFAGIRQRFCDPPPVPAGLAGGTRLTFRFSQDGRAVLVEGDRDFSLPTRRHPGIATSRAWNLPLTSELTTRRSPLTGS